MMSPVILKRATVQMIMRTDSSAGKTRSFKLDLSTWYGKAIVIAIAALIVILLTTVLVAVAPFLIIFGIVLYLISWYRKKKV